ncbi:MAG TPA: hypothetical protein VH518_00350 [Tepidisphaeraceae bacterium]|jgi:chromosome segregation ATPase
MAEGARVESIDALKHFRVALFKFQEAANAALADAEGDLSSTLNWLENEQYMFWQNQIRKRHELLERAKEAVRMKKLFKDSSGRTPSAVEEEKAMLMAKRRLEEAEEKFNNVKKYTRVLQREIQTYKGSVQRFATTVQSDLPVAVAMLDNHVTTLEQYVMLAPGDAQAASPVGSESVPPPPPETEETGTGEATKS